MAESELRRWISSEGGLVHDLVELSSSFGDGYRGVRALEPLAEGELLLRVPLRLCMHIPLDGSLDEDEVVRELRAQPDFGSFMQTTLLLLAERSKGEASRYATHIGSMPKDHDCTLSWTGEELALLQGTELVEAGGEDVEGAWRVADEFMAAHRDSWPEATCSRETFDWAAGMVQSRSFHIQTNNWVTGARTDGATLFLIPGIDMLNHSTEPKQRATELELDGIGKIPAPTAATAEVADVAEDSFIMRVNRAVIQDEEVLHTYGDLSDGELLRTYGFVEDGDNPHGYVTLALGDLAAAASKLCGQDSGALLERKPLLEGLGLVQGDRVRAPRTADSKVDDVLGTVAQVLLLDEEGLAEYSEMFSGAEGEGPHGLLDTSGEAGVARVVMQAVDARNARYREGAAKAQASGATRRRTDLARRVVRSERKVLLHLKQAAFLQLAQALEEGSSSSSEGEGDEDDNDSEEASESSSDNGTDAGGVGPSPRKRRA